MSSDRERRSHSRSFSRSRSGSRDSRSPSRSRSGSPSGSGSGENTPARSRDNSPEAEVHEEQGTGTGGGEVQFCSIHKVDLKPDTCNVCRHVSHMIKPNVLKELVRGGPRSGGGDVPSAAERFCRSDEKPPSLILTETSMDLATKIFSLGRFKVPHHFEDLTKEYLFLPNGQNETLTANLTMENMFRQYEKGGRHKHVFLFKNQVVKAARDMRVAQVFPTWPNGKNFIIL